MFSQAERRKRGKRCRTQTKGVGVRRAGVLQLWLESVPQGPKLAQQLAVLVGGSCNWEGGPDGDSGSPPSLSLFVSWLPGSEWLPLPHFLSMTGSKPRGQLVMHETSQTVSRIPCSHSQSCCFGCFTAAVTKSSKPNY